jgi:hypothetical protein
MFITIILIILIFQLLIPILKKRWGSHDLRVLSTIAKKTVGDACPQGALKNHKKQWGTLVLRVLSKITKTLQ